MSQTKGNIKKNKQLGMNHSTASNRLVKDLLWSYIVKEEQNFCYHCNEEMDRESFSIEHKIPWLDSEEPKTLFFELENISFSHLSCNCRMAKKPHKKYQTEEERIEARNRLARERYFKLSKEAKQKRRRSNYEKYKC